MSYPGPHGQLPPARHQGLSPVFWIAAIGLPLLLLAGCLAAVTTLANPASEREALDLPTQPGAASSIDPPTITEAPVSALSSAPDQVVTVTAEAPASQPPATQEPINQPSAAATTSEPPKKALPNVVGMDLQTAQDTMQAAGFIFLRDKDDTGQDRFQVFDRNWVVTRQEPEAGQEISVATWVTLFAKKKSDP